MSFKVIKFPDGDTKFEFYYYRQYVPSEKSESEVIINPAKTLYVCNFDHEIEVGFVKKFFGLCGHINQVLIGSKRVKKGKKRMINFAIVSFKHKEAVLSALNGEFLQAQINIVLRKAIELKMDK